MADEFANLAELNGAPAFGPGIKERRQKRLGTVIEVEECDGGEAVCIHWRHEVNESQSSVSSQTVARDVLIPVVCK